MYNKIVDFASLQTLGKIIPPCFALALVGGVEHSHLLIENKVGVITHAFRHVILTFKEVNVQIINANVFNLF